jgi:hypothetical protein
VKSDPLTGENLLLILSITHKYCMERITSDTIEELKKTSTYDGFVDIVVASQILDSKPLYEEGIRRLISSGLSPSTEQSRRLGTDATHTVMMAVIDALRAEMSKKVKTANAERDALAVALTQVDNTKCQYCHQQTRWTCQQNRCRRQQAPLVSPPRSPIYLA